MEVLLNLEAVVVVWKGIATTGLLPGVPPPGGTPPLELMKPAPPPPGWALPDG